MERPVTLRLSLGPTTAALERRRTVPVGMVPSVMATGDFNGDGIVDLVLGGTNAEQRGGSRGRRAWRLHVDARARGGSAAGLPCGRRSHRGWDRRCRRGRSPGRSAWSSCLATARAVSGHRWPSAQPPASCVDDTAAHRRRPHRVSEQRAAADSALPASGGSSDVYEGVLSLTLSPATIAGGSGASSTGTVTLNAPAPDERRGGDARQFERRAGRHRAQHHRSRRGNAGDIHRDHELVVSPLERVGFQRHHLRHPRRDCQLDAQRDSAGEARGLQQRRRGVRSDAVGRVDVQQHPSNGLRRGDSVPMFAASARPGPMGELHVQAGMQHRLPPRAAIRRQLQRLLRHHRAEPHRGEQQLHRQRRPRASQLDPRGTGTGRRHHLRLCDGPYRERERQRVPQRLTTDPPVLPVPEPRFPDGRQHRRLRRGHLVCAVDRTSSSSTANGIRPEAAEISSSSTKGGADTRWIAAVPPNPPPAAPIPTLGDIQDRGREPRHRRATLARAVAFERPDARRRTDHHRDEQPPRDCRRR